MARTKGTARSSRSLRPLRNARKSALCPSPPPLPQPTTQSTRVLRSHTAAQQAAQQAATTASKPAKRRTRQDPWAPKRKVNPNPKPPPPPPTHFTCRICIEEQPTSQFPRWVPPRRRRYRVPWDVPLPCNAHLARNPSNKKKDPVCNTCIGNMMSARLDTVGARRVTGCVDPACRNDWSWDFIMRYMPKDAALEKFNMEMLEVWKQDLTHKLVECISPTCNAIGLPETNAPGYPQVSCNECGIRTCAQCLVPWHVDVTCAEYAAKDINEKMSDPEKDTLKFMQTKDGKRCPNCFLVIEKDGGCDSMYCIGCYKYFNWATAASAVPGTTKAQPFIIGQAYWYQHDTSAVCEVDALNAKDHGGAPLMRLIPEVS